MKRHRVRRNHDQPGETAEPRAAGLSHAEQVVLTMFRQFLMTPGKMLCFSQADQATYEAPLAKLIERGLLVGERFRGGYSLTADGFASMRRCA